MSVLCMLLFALVSGSAFGQTKYDLNIRVGDQICTQWLPAGTQITYSTNRECTTAPAWERQVNNPNTVRLCCKGLPLTTPTTNFPHECGKQQYQPHKLRIIGGFQATANSWPWQILLIGAGSMCGGTLIDERHVLTAAHCISTPVNASDYKVTVGAHETNKPMYMEQEIVASNVWVHEQYTGPSGNYQHDIAVIRLSKPIKVSDKVNFICLPGAEVKGVNQTIWISGWGKTEYLGNTSPILKQTWLYTLDSCGRYFTNFNSEKQICAGRYGGGSDTCQGDSGGPLMFESEGKWFLNGVVSYGSQCGTTGVPSVYTRVSYYLPWIRAKMAL